MGNFFFNVGPLKQLRVAQFLVISGEEGPDNGDRRGGFRRDGQGFNRDRQNGGYNRGPRPEGGFRKPAEKKEGGAQ